jgi:CTP synthase (UTP-ammonia lyase)
MNPEFRAAIERAGLRVVGEDDHGDARVVELSGHPFFIGTLFQPQLESSPGAPAPLLRALVDAAIHHRDRRSTPNGIDAIVATSR